MPAILPTIAAVVGIGTGIKNLTGSGGGSAQGAQNAANDAAARADPFGNYRDQFAQMLRDRFDKLTNTSFDQANIVNDPGYQFALKSGTDAVNRGSAASGMFGSGNRLIELEKMGVGLASQYATQQQDRQWNQNMGILQMLGNFSGANINPATAAQLQYSGYQQGQKNTDNAWNQIGGGLAGLKPFFQNWGSSGGNTDSSAWNFGISDIRTKTDITPIGKTKTGLNTYSFRYKGLKDLHVGVMAHEVEDRYPDAVVEVDGIKVVNYTRLSELGA